MFKMIMTLTLMMMLATLMMMLCMLISKNTILDREKMSPFECGFDPKSSSRMPFSIQFFLIAVLFLIFDIEIVIILPMVTTMSSSMLMTWSMTISMFVLILIMGLMHEWKNGILEWAK
uniref:NADH-ubiquinone oxidoreductase chain 3 n=1 Tax=Paraplea frontalis TaxID=575836 RepID=A0A059T926_9HEMI|nr:NADH dehydrogenase subunit 3 [Paraplea frontalis]AHL44235.1 NADH dehydrogenase subunit 3 [Paraplea frontalis]